MNALAESFELSCSTLGDEGQLVAFRGREGLSQLLHFEVFVTVPIDAIPARDALLGQGLTLSIRGGLADVDPAHIHGLIAGFEVLEEISERVLLRLDVRPTFWLLTQSRHSRVFTECTVPDIIKEVFGVAGLNDYELRLDSDYAAEPHVSQHEESDFAFLQRLMEHEGIYFFFEHDSSVDKLIITDSMSRHQPSRASAVPFFPVIGGEATREVCEAFRERRRLLPKLVRLTDYRYENPALAVKGEADVRDLVGAEVVIHDARAFAPADAQRLATIRKEELLSVETVFEASGTASHLRSGFTFQISGHPRQAINDGRFLCIDLEHVGNLRARTAELAARIGIDPLVEYEARARAISADVQFRPTRAARRPRIAGLVRATIDGADDSDYAQLDDQGRYRIKLAYEETARKGDESSVRTRMMQPHAGNPEGWHLPLRKGTEVMVAFIAGDPDRPIIAGAVPNAETPSVVTSQNHTRNIFHSGGDNVVEIEDLDGKQWFDVRSPTKDSRLHLGTPHDDDSHYVVAHSDADCRFTIGTNQDIRVGAKLTEDVKGDVTEKYNTSQTSKVVGTQGTTVLGAVEETYQTGHKSTVTGLVSELYIAGQKTSVTGQRFELYDTTQKTLVLGGATHTYDKQDMAVNGADSTQMHCGPKTVTVPGACKYTFDGSVTQLFGPTTYICPTVDWTFKNSGKIFTPSWTQLFATYGNTNAERTYNDAVTVSCWGMVVALISPLKSETVGIAFGINGVKLEDTLINVSASALSVNITLLKITSEPLEINATPFKKIGC